jgi:uncharacterized protein (DUF433 family)
MTEALGQGFYTLQEASKLIGTSDQKLRAWLRPTRDYTAAVASDRVEDGRVADIGFFDLVELHFIDHFRNQGVSLQTLRKINARAREEHGTNPFARRGFRFRTDRVKIYSQAASETGDRILMDLTERQYVLDVIEHSLAEGIDFDPETELARLWLPRAWMKEIVVDPRLNFGRPSIRGYGIGTRAIFDQWEAEGGDEDIVAAWFRIPTELVGKAVEFESVRIQ